MRRVVTGANAKKNGTRDRPRGGTTTVADKEGTNTSTSIAPNCAYRKDTCRHRENVEFGIRIGPLAISRHPEDVLDYPLKCQRAWLIQRPGGTHRYYVNAYDAQQPGVILDRAAFDFRGGVLVLIAQIP